MQRFRKFGACGLQFLPVQEREAPQKLFAVRSQVDQNLPPILLAGVPNDGAVLGQPINKFYRAVVAQAQAL